MAEQSSFLNFFRPEAQRHAHRRIDGEVILAIEPSASLLGAIAIGVVLLAVLLAGMSQYAHTVKIDGWIVPSNGLIRLTAPRGGVVESVQVAEGQFVRAGSPIATVSLSRGLDGGDELVLLRRSQAAAAAANDERARANLDAIQIEDTRLRRRRALLDTELGQARNRELLQRDQVKLASEDLERYEAAAASGFIPKRQVTALRASLNSARQQLASDRAAISEIESNIAEIDAQIRAVPSREQAARAEAAGQRAQQEQLLTRTEVEGRYVIKATHDGRVAALAVTAGQSIGADALVAVVTPSGAPLEAELFAPSQSAGLLRPGQRVRLEYNAFSHERFGSGAGRVLAVSKSALAPTDVPMPGLGLQEPVFRIRVTIERPAVTAQGRKVPLEPGNKLTGQVEVERRSVLDWIIAPLFGKSREA